MRTLELNKPSASYEGGRRLLGTTFDLIFVAKWAQKFSLHPFFGAGIGLLSIYSLHTSFGGRKRRVIVLAVEVVVSEKPSRAVLSSF